jgi:hypothetical protein
VKSVLQQKNCTHSICLKCLSVNDLVYCPITECRKKLSDVDIHRKKIYVRSLEYLGRKHLINIRQKLQK